MKASRRTPADLVYLVAVASLGLLFAAGILERALPPVASAARGAPSAGQPRDVDVEALERLIGSGLLSDREALHARPLDGPRTADEGAKDGD